MVKAGDPLGSKPILGMVYGEAGSPGMALLTPPPRPISGAEWHTSKHNPPPRKTCKLLMPKFSALSALLRPAAHKECNGACGLAATQCRICVVALANRRST
jgi:hypothetical protein